MQNNSLILFFLLIPSLCFGGVTFDKTDDVICIGSDASVDDIGAMTIYAVINATDAGENNLGYILGKLGGTQAWSFGINSLNQIAFFWGGSSENLSVGSAAITTGSTYKVILTWDGVITTANSVHIYFNGVESASYPVQQNGSGTHADGAGNLCIGNRDTDTARTWAGWLEEIAIWDEVLSTSEIEQLSKSNSKRMPLQISPANLISYLPLDECADGVACTGAGQFKDLKGTNHGTATNNPTGRAGTLLTYP